MPIGSHPFAALPDIVRDARLEAEIFATHTKNVSYASGSSVHERRLRTEELWFRDRQLGHGAYGIVHLERCDRGGHARLRAVKQIKKDIVPGDPLDYTRELEAIMKFSHPNYTHCFVRSDGWYESPDYVFITMEYLEHGDLQRHLAKPLPEHEARLITGQILEGLKLMHENGFTHRDLKPGNIMVVTKGPGWFVKIADFGITKRRHQDATSLHTLQRGSIGFAAPEALGFNGGQGSYTSAVDMWSLGAVVYIMLTSLTPFAAFEVFQYAAGQLGFPLEPLQKLAVSTQGQDFIASLMRVNGLSRLSSAVANTHPWMTTPLASISGTTGASETITSMASASWSTITDCPGQPSDTIKILVTQPNELTVKHTTPRYRSPSVEDCVDETQEGDREVLPPSSPYVLEVATTPSPDVPHSQSPVTPGSPFWDTNCVSVAVQSVSSCEDGASIRSLQPGSPASRPHFSRDSEKTDLRRKISTRSAESGRVSVAQNQSEENARTSEPPPQTQYSFDETGNSSDDDGRSDLLVYLERCRRELDLFPTAKPRVSQRCFFCGDAYPLKRMIPSGPIELAPCQHWLCHCCLMELFARDIICKEVTIQCCGQVIPLRLFRSILVDPEVNALKRCPEPAKSSVYHRFICTLLRNRQFASVDIADQIRNIIGDGVWRRLVESAATYDWKQPVEDEYLGAEPDREFVRKSQLPRPYAGQDAKGPYVPAAPPALPPGQRYATPEDIFNEVPRGERLAPPRPHSSQPPFSETEDPPSYLRPNTADGHGWNSTRNPTGYESGRDNDEYTGQSQGVPHQPPSSDRTPMNPADAAHAWRVRPLADEYRRPPIFEPRKFDEDDVQYANYLPVDRERELRTTTPLKYSDVRYSPYHRASTFQPAPPDGERERRASAQESERLRQGAAPRAPRPDGMDARGPRADDVRGGGRRPKARVRSRGLPKFFFESDSGSSSHGSVACQNGRRLTNKVGGVGMPKSDILHWLRSVDGAGGS